MKNKKIELNCKLIFKSIFNSKLRSLIIATITLFSGTLSNATTTQDIKVQAQLLKNSFSNLETDTPNNVDWYALTVAGNARQGVFKNEVEFVDTWFDTQLGDSQHSLTLVNDADSWNKYPLANKGNIRRSLNQISQKMNKEEDVLFLSLTSHGSVGEILLENDLVDMSNLESEWLKKTLDDTGIRWRVIVISACYSGSFIEDLKTRYTIVMTAAASDRSSFGCSNDNKYTYFGRAFFIDALTNSQGMEEAFTKAKKEIGIRETKMDFRPSKPQIFIGSEMKNKLKLLEETLFTKK